MKTNFANLTSIYNHYRSHYELITNRCDPYRERLNGKCNIEDKQSRHTRVAIPDITLGETYYVVYNDTLCQARFDSLTRADRLKAECILHGVVAYNGRIEQYTCNLEGFYGGTNIYATIEDYKNHKQVRNLSVSLLWLFDFLTDGCYNLNEYYQVGSCSFYYLWRYKWDGARPEPTRTDLWTKCTECVTIYADRVIVGNDHEDLNECLAEVLRTTYATAKECEVANTLQVCTFDDCEPTERVVVKTTKVTIEITEEQRIVLAQMGINL